MEIQFTNINLTFSIYKPFIYDGPTYFTYQGYVDLRSEQPVWNAGGDTILTTDYIPIYKNQFEVSAIMGNPYGLGISFYSEKSTGESVNTFDYWISTIYNVIPDTFKNEYYVVNINQIPDNAKYIRVGAYNTDLSPISTAYVKV